MDHIANLYPLSGLSRLSGQKKKHFGLDKTDERRGPVGSSNLGTTLSMQLMLFV